MHRQFSSSPDGTANTSRRAFLAQTGKAALASLVAGAAAAPLGAAEVKYPAYENNLQDRLWMWGHDPGAYDGPKGVYNIPPVSYTHLDVYKRQEERDVITGGSYGGAVRVLSGVEPGERVVVKGSDRMFPNARVWVQEDK